MASRVPLQTLFHLAACAVACGFLPPVVEAGRADLNARLAPSRSDSPQAADAPAAIGGSVVDPDGRPVSGATVVLDTPAGVARAARTDGSGRYDVSGLAPGAYAVHVTAPGLAADAVPVRVAAGERRELQVVLRLSAVTDQVVVSAAQTEALASAAPATLTLFTARDLEARQLVSLADVMRLTPGMSVAQSGGDGALTSVFPRGGESDYTLVLVDGVRVNAFGGGLDFASLPMSGVDRIEVVHGPQSALFGADAIGGVVHVVTRQGGPVRGSVLAEAGSRDTRRATAAAAGSLGRWSWGADGEGAASDGFNGLAAAPGGVSVANDDHDRQTAGASLRASGRAWTLGGHARLARTERGFPGPFGSDPNGTFPGVDRVSRGWTDHLTLGSQGTLTLSPRVRVRGGASWAALDSRFRSPLDTSDNDTRRADGRVQVDAALSEIFGVSAGGEKVRESARSTYITAGDVAPRPVERDVTGLFAELRAEVANRVTANTGVRVERIHRASLAGDPTGFTPRPAFAADTVVSVNPRAAVSWFVRDAAPGAFSWTRVRATAGTGIRPPDAFEIAFTDNPALAPERSRSVEVGVEQALAEAAVVADVTWFWNEYDDLIVAVGRSYQDASRYRTDNIANARARGLEASVSARAGHWLRVGAGYTFLDSAVLAVDGAPGQAPAPFAVGDPLIRRPRHRGWLELLATAGNWSSFARVGARGRVLDVDPNYGAFGGTVQAPGFAVTDLGASVTVWRELAVFGRVTNVFDRAYEEAFGFPSPGRVFMGGLRVAAGR